MSVQILHRDDLPLGGFAGLTEHRLVVDTRVGGGENTWEGFGSFVYLADARFQPKGDTTMHPHKEIDVISLVVEGRIVHEGSLEHGQSMTAGQAQVQRAGAEGFSHNEINPDDAPNRMIQIWALPETSGERASYKLFDLKKGGLTRVYGGDKDQNETHDSHTIIEIGNLVEQQEILKSGDFLAYITKGAGNLNGADVKDGDLVRGAGLNFVAQSDEVQLIVVTMEEL